MSVIYTAALFGLIGGLIRALMGILKHYRITKTAKFKPAYLTITLILSAVIGMLVSVSISTNYLLNLVAGYAGIDFLENIIKISKRKS